MTAGFHLRLGIVWAAIMAASVVTMLVTGVHIQGAGSITITLVLGALCFSPVPLYLRTAKRTYLLDCVLCLGWIVFLSYASFFPIAAACRLGRSFPLQDAFFARLDFVDLPAIHAWAEVNPIGRWINWSYNQILYLEVGAAVLPLMFGKVARVKKLLAAYTLALLISLPVVVFLPAIGPWYGYQNIAGDAGQRAITAEILNFRGAGADFIPTGVICCPSFHVIWTILFAWTLWEFRWLRPLVGTLAASIVISTITKGCHYTVDGLAGLLVSAVVIWAAERLPVVSQRSSRAWAHCWPQICFMFLRPRNFVRAMLPTDSTHTASNQ